MSKKISELVAAGALGGAELVEVSTGSASVTITATTISAAAADNSFNDSAAGFVTAGFAVGDSVRVQGFTEGANNIISGRVTSVVAGKIIIGGADGDVIVDEAAGDSVTITKWESRRATVDDIGGSFDGALNANLNITGTARRISADFSAGLADRAAIQTNVTNGATTIGVLPNGTGVNAGVNMFSAADSANASYLQMLMLGGTEARIHTSKTGTGTVRPLTVYHGDVEHARFAGNGFFEVSAAGHQADITATTYGVNGGGIFHGRYARGTRESPTAVQSGDIFAGIGGRPYRSNGTFASSSPTSIHWTAAENQTSTAMGSCLSVLTTPKGSATREERLAVTDKGTIWCHSPSASWDKTNDAHSRPSGFAAATSALFLASATGADQAGFGAISYGQTAGAGFRGGVAGGTIASPAATPADTMVSFLAGHVYSASGWMTGAPALVALHAAENATDSAKGTYIALGTTPKGSATRAERVRVKPAGQVRFVPLSAAPTVDVEAGDVYYDSTLEKLRCWNGSSWNNLF